MTVTYEGSDYNLEKLPEATKLFNELSRAGFIRIRFTATDFVYTLGGESYRKLDDVFKELLTIGAIRKVNR